MLSDFYKISKDDKIWWAREIVDENIIGGAIYFSFDKKKIFNLLSDYPDKLTEEELSIFNKENPEFLKKY